MGKLQVSSGNYSEKCEIFTGKKAADGMQIASGAPYFSVRYAPHDPDHNLSAPKRGLLVIRKIISRLFHMQGPIARLLACVINRLRYPASSAC